MKIVTIVGARPQFIKAAVVSRAIRAHNGQAPPGENTIREIIVHTGQHYDYLMSQVFFEELGLPAPDYDLEVGSGPHGVQTGLMLSRIEDVLQKEEPDWVLVYGDTNSTLAGALASAKLHIPVAHVEAGLRSFNRRMPEEINRVLTDHISSVLFCPTETAVKNLEREGITQGVHLVGDVMYEALANNVRTAESRSTILQQLGLKPTEYFLVTVHRAENTDDPSRLHSIIGALVQISAINPVVWPTHPRSRKALESRRSAFPSCEGIRLIDPLPYLDMLMLEKHAKAILTDSGGVQKEAYWFGVPCITLREETEWVETVEAGWNTLVGTDSDRIVATAESSTLAGGPSRPCGDGRAAERVVGILAGFDGAPTGAAAAAN